MLADIALRHRDYAEPELYDPRGRYGDVRLDRGRPARGRHGARLGPGHQHDRRAGSAGRATCSTRSASAGETAPGRSPTSACSSRWSSGSSARSLLGPGAGAGAGVVATAGCAIARATWSSSTCSGSSPTRTAPGPTPRFAEILPTVESLVTAFGDAVTFTRFVAPEQPDRGVARLLRRVAVRAAAAGRAAVRARAASSGHRARPWTPPRSASGARSWPTGWATARRMVLCGGVDGLLRALHGGGRGRRGRRGAGGRRRLRGRVDRRATAPGARHARAVRAAGAGRQPAPCWRMTRAPGPRGRRAVRPGRGRRARHADRVDCRARRSWPATARWWTASTRRRPAIRSPPGLPAGHRHRRHRAGRAARRR